MDHGLSFDVVEDYSLYNVITDAVVPEKAVQQIIETEKRGQDSYEQLIVDRLKED